MINQTSARQMLVDLKPVLNRCREQLADIDPEILAGLRALDILDNLVAFHKRAHGVITSDEEQDDLAEIVRQAAKTLEEAFAK